MRMLIAAFYSLTALVLIVRGSYEDVTVLTNNNGSRSSASIRGYKEVDLSSWTVCIRFRPETLRKDATVLEIPYSTESDDDVYLLRLLLTYMDYAFVNIQRRTLMVSTSFQVYKWNYVCCGFDMEKKKVHVSINGHQEQFELPVSYDKLTNLTVKHLSATVVGSDSNRENSFFGSISNLNIWSRVLTPLEAKNWEQCKLNSVGDIFNGGTGYFDANLLNVSTMSLLKEQACAGNDSKLIWIPEPLTFDESNLFCKNIGGTMLKITSDVSNSTIHHLKDKHPDVFAGLRNLWTGLTKDGLAKDWNALDWWESEPNGKDKEQCIAMIVPSQKYYDVGCTSVKNGYCHLKTLRNFRLRNLSKKKVDFLYFLNMNVKNGKYVFDGLQHNKIIFSDDGYWAIIDSATEAEILTLEDSVYPFGYKLWRDPALNTTYMLSFDQCSDEEFNCADGTCIPQQRKCNGKADCADISDEVNCTKIDLPFGYEQTQSPISTYEGIGLEIKITQLNFFIRSIEGQQVSLQFGIFETWRDSRLVFYDIVSRTNNTLTRKDLEKIWTPNCSVYYSYTGLEEVKEFTVLDVAPTKSGTMSGTSRLKNTRIFSGDSVDITLRRWYSLGIICPAKELWYFPFDRNYCIFRLAGSLHNSWESLGFDGLISYAIEVEPTYFLGDLGMSRINNMSVNVDGRGTMEVTFYLDRQFGSTFMQYLLPNILLSYVVYSSLTYYLKDFGTAVTVNITCLLAMTGFFSMVFQHLPQSSNVKIIELMQIKSISCSALIIFLQTLVSVNSLSQVDVYEGKRKAWAMGKGLTKLTKSTSRLNLILRLIPAFGITIDIVYIVFGFYHEMEPTISSQ